MTWLHTFFGLFFIPEDFDGAAIPPPIFSMGQSHPPLGLWQEQRQNFLLQKALNYKSSPLPQIFRPSYGPALEKTVVFSLWAFFGIPASLSYWKETIANKMQTLEECVSKDFTEAASWKKNHIEDQIV